MTVLRIHILISSQTVLRGLIHFCLSRWRMVEHITECLEVAGLLLWGNLIIIAIIRIIINISIISIMYVV